MRVVFTLYAFLFTLLSCFSQSSFEFEKDRSKITIPFKLINNLLFIPIKVNGEELTFLLDTGVEETVLFSLDDKEQVQFFHLEKIMLKGLGSNEAVEAYKSSKNKFEINGFTDNNHEIYLVLDQEFNFSSQVGIPVNGIIGYHFFKNHLVEIDYERRKIIVYNQNHQKVRKKLSRGYIEEPIVVEENKPYYSSNVTTTGKKLSAKLLIDTGNSDAVWLFLNRSKDIQLPPKTISDYLGRGFSGSVYGMRGRIDEFTFGNHVFKKPIGTFPDSTSIKSVNFVAERVGSVGGEILSRFSIFFDYPNQKLYTKPNADIQLPFNFNMSGIEVQHDGLEWVTDTYQAKKQSTNSSITVYNVPAEERVQNNLLVKFELKPIFTIHSIRKDSPAELAGLKKNDRLLSINGRSTHDLSIEKINELLRSEDGKTIEVEIERNGREYKFRFQLKSII